MADAALEEGEPFPGSTVVGNVLHVTANVIENVIVRPPSSSPNDDMGTDLQTAPEEIPGSSFNIDTYKADLGANGFQVYRLEALCDRLMSSSTHFKALDKLKRLHELQPDSVKTMLMLAECNIWLKKYKEAFEVIKKIRKVILQKPRPETHDLIIEADECRELKKFFTSLILLSCACSVYETDRTPKDALDGIAKCLNKIDELWDDISEHGEAVRKLPAEVFSSISSLLMKDIERQLRGLKDTDPDLHTKILLRCLGSIADYINDSVHLGEAIERYNSCITILENQFGPNAPKCYMLGEFLWNIGRCYHALGETARGNEYLKKAQVALMECEPATDIEITYKQMLQNKIEKVLNTEGGISRIIKALRK